jgi:hypothetical protein
MSLLPQLSKASLRAIRLNKADTIIQSIREIITDPSVTDSDRLCIFKTITQDYCETCGAPIESSTGQCKDLCNAR